MLLGNLPIYKGDGSHTISGCEYVINFKKENNSYILYFIKQNQPYLLDTNKLITSPKLVLDKISLVRLISYLKQNYNNNFKLEYDYLYFGKTRILNEIHSDECAYLDLSDIPKFLIEYNKEKFEFSLYHDIQVQLFIDTLEELKKTEENLNIQSNKENYISNNNISNAPAAPVVIK